MINNKNKRRNNNKNSKGNLKLKNKVWSNRANQGSSLVTNIPRSAYPIICPESFRVTLVYNDNSVPRNNIGSSYLYFAQRGNGLFDPDPLLLTGSISGFAEWGAFYRQYIVESITVKWIVCNKEAFPVTVVCAPSNVSLATVITSHQAAVNLGENKLSTVRNLSMASGQDRTIIVKNINWSRYIANPVQYLGGTFSGFGGFAPSNPIVSTFLDFAAYADNVFSAGISSSLRIEYHTKWYDIQSLQA
jgi:hypothetical protein